MRDLLLAAFENTELSLPKRFITIYQSFLSDNTPQKHLALKEIIEAADDFDFEDYDDEKDPEIVSLVNSHYALLREVVITISKQNLSSDIFYEKLYKNVFLSDLFPQNESDRGLLLFLLSLRIRQLPYYEVQNSVVLSNTEFSSIAEQIWEKIVIANYMMNDRFDTKTETASQLCNIADSLESREQKAVFWAYVMSANRPKQQRD